MTIQGMQSMFSAVFMCFSPYLGIGRAGGGGSVGEWVQEQQAKVDKAKAMLQRVRERQWNKKNKHRVPATYQEEDWVLVHHSRLPAWPRSTSDDPYFGPYKILSVLPRGWYITCLCSFLSSAAQKSKFSKVIFLIL